MVAVSTQSILLRPSSFPGPCVRCRHANHGTDDFVNYGLVACRFGLGDRASAQCDKQLTDKEGKPLQLWLFEEFDGQNSTWFYKGPIEIIPPPGFQETRNVVNNAEKLIFTNDPQVWEAPEKFALTKEPQDALFEMSFGWVGGMGEAVLEPGSTDKLKCFGKYPIYINSRIIQELLEEHLIRWDHPLRIRVSANIMLKKRHRLNRSIPRFSLWTFYEVRVNELHKIYVYSHGGEHVRRT